MESKKILIVVGEHRPFIKEEQEAFEKFCECYNCAIYTNLLSNYNGKYAVLGNLLFSTISYSDYKKDLKPDIIISIGGQTGDYPLYGVLSKQDSNHIEHWRVSISGDVVDTYDKLTKIFECSEKYFFSRLSTSKKAEHTYFESILRYMQFNIKIDLPFSNVFAAQELTQLIPDNSIVQFSILNSLRVWNLFEFKNRVFSFSNVGAFGIDGGMSTLIGQSVVSKELCFMIIGDLAFFYDMNSLGIRDIKNNLRILLINNNGGVEFKLGMKENESINRFIAAGNHFKNAKGWAETCGMRYISARNKSEFIKLKEIFVSKSNQPILFELFVSDTDDALAYNKLIKTNKKNTTSETLRDGMKASVKKLLSKSL